ncbi:type III secretion system chaperone [Pantoea stewartii]|uniref:type III secretion system chaperone n=1 Tax=Pantoea stewartii TaxID=66269 RepID=UPI00197D91CB|nr:type III secretion system chaperone [Pantoea stewartii]
MLIQDLLSVLARRLGTGELVLDANNLCCIQVDTLEMNVEFVEQQKYLFVYISVGVVSARQHGSFLMDVLSANLFYHGTNGEAAFSLDHATSELMLFQRVNITSIDEAIFVEHCVQLIEVAKKWQTTLQIYNAEKSTTPHQQSHQRLILNGKGEINEYF